MLATITPPTLEPVEEEIETETALVGEDGEPIEPAEGERRRGAEEASGEGPPTRTTSPEASARSTPVDWLVVGLGNPGPGYAETPHNVGFKVAEALARRWDLPKPKKKFAGELSEGRTGPGGPRVAVLRPQTYMNEAGRSVGPARGSFKLDLDHLVVVHDEIDLPFGDIRSRLGGGLAGHNGLKSLKRELGGADFHRVRVGVGRPDSTDPEIVAAYVLGRWRQPRRRGGRPRRPRRRRGRADPLYAITYARMSPRDWNAAAYQRLAAPIEAMGRDVLQRLELDGDETVLDAGCGTGRVTAALAERLPRGRVIAVDGSRVDGREGARAAARTASTCARPTCSS